MAGIIGPDGIDQDVELSCDAVVIGSGAGGAVAAKELAERGRSVVVVEEGARFTANDFNRRPVDMMNLLYRDGAGAVAFGTPPIPIPLGKTVGGSTTINSGTCFRTPDRILDKWEKELGIEGIGPDRMGPYFDRVEKIQNVIPVKRELWGRNGELVARGAEKLGWSHGPLKRNVNDRCSGCAVCCFGCPTDAKLAMNLTYIPRAVAAGATVYTCCRAERVTVENGRAVGLEAAFVDRPYKLRVRAKAVVLSAGTIHSPYFLLKNRLANSSGEVGRHLTLHPASRCTALFDERVEGWKGVPQGYMVDQFKDEGIMMEGVGGPPGLLAQTLPGVGREYGELLAQVDHVAAFGIMVSDTSEGRVRYAPGGLPLVTYQINQHDTDRMVRGISLLAELYFAAGAKRVFPAIHGWEWIKSPDDLRKLREAKIPPGHHELTAFHPLGTCRMGRDPRRSVVDASCETHDVKGLYVVDGSVFPTSLGVNPQITIMAFATRAAERLSERLG